MNPDLVFWVERWNPRLSFLFENQNICKYLALFRNGIIPYNLIIASPIKIILSTLFLTGRHGMKIEYRLNLLQSEPLVQKVRLLNPQKMMILAWNKKKWRIRFNLRHFWWDLFDLILKTGANLKDLRLLFVSQTDLWSFCSLQFSKKKTGQNYEFSSHHSNPWMVDDLCAKIRKHFCLTDIAALPPTAASRLAGQVFLYQQANNEKSAVCFSVQLSFRARSSSKTDLPF